jgi:hypothetical protein
MSDQDALLRTALTRVVELEDGQQWPRLSEFRPEHKELLRQVNAKLLTLRPTADLWVWAPDGQALSAFHLIPNLIRITETRGADDGMAWLTRVYRPQAADLTVYTAVIGIEPTTELRLGNGVKIIPASALSNSSGLKWAIEQQRRALLGRSDVLAVAAVVCPNFPYIDLRERAHEPFDARHSKAQDELYRTIEGFTMAGPCAPTGSWCWSEVSDPELQLLDLPGFSHRAIEGGTQYRSKGVVTPEDAKLVTRYLAIEGEWGRTLEIAMNRLNLAQCRLSPGNKAIEAAMCIEALLGSKDQKEGLAHRYSLRAALLWAEIYEERSKIRNTVKALYNYRSAIVHGADPWTTKVKKKPPYELVQEGINLCGSLIRKLVELGGKPNWDQLELNGGLAKATNDESDEG